MSENINNVDLLLVKDEKIKESLERLLVVREELKTTEHNIEFQNEEMTKTEKMIAEYKEYYDAQKSALDHFCREKDRLNAEHSSLIHMVNIYQNEETVKNITRKKNKIDIKRENRISKRAKLKEGDTACDSDVTKANEMKIVANDVKTISNNIIDGIITIRNESVEERVFTPSVPPITKKKILSINLKKAKKNPILINTEPKSKLPVRKVISSDPSVTLKMTTPMHSFLTLDTRYKIHKINVTTLGSFICGSHGLLLNNNELKLEHYRGHSDYYVYNFYVYQGVIVSMGLDYALMNHLKDPYNFKMISSFSSRISCSCLHMSTIYGALEDGVMFLIDLCDQRIDIRGHILPTQTKAMVVVRSLNSLYLVVGKRNGEIVRYSLHDNLYRCREVGKVDGTLRGIVTDGNIMIGYTEHGLYYIDKKSWIVTLIRETSNSITFVDVCAGLIIFVDNSNMLHKYKLKKGRIASGSSIESLPITSKITAFQANELEQKIFIASMSEIQYHKI